MAGEGAKKEQKVVVFAKWVGAQKVPRCLVEREGKKSNFEVKKGFLGQKRPKSDILRKKPPLAGSSVLVNSAQVL
jgi:hypothetical protein